MDVNLYVQISLTYRHFEIVKRAARVKKQPKFGNGDAGMTLGVKNDANAEIFVLYIEFRGRTGIKSDGNRKHLADSIKFPAENAAWNGIIMKTARNLSCLGVNYANADRQRGNARLKLHFHRHK